MGMNRCRTLLVTLALAATACAAGRSVSDDGETWVFGQGSGDGKNHTFRNKGPDLTITVVCYTAARTIASSTTLAPETDVQINVPYGGSAKVVDNSDADSDGATGTYPT
jgi:hypothetical protein